MRKSFNSYLLAGLAATSVAVVISPMLTNLYLGTTTLIYAATMIIIGAMAASIWAAGPNERRTNTTRWALAGLTAGGIAAFSFILIASLGFFAGISLGHSFGEWATLAVAFTGAACLFLSAGASYWIAWRYMTPKVQTDA